VNGQDDFADETLSLRSRIEELERELAARDEFIIAAAHELRNPISPLMLHVHRLASTAKKAGEGTVQAPWLSDQLVVVGQRLTRFLSALNRILDVSSINSGRIELLEEPLDLSEVVRDVVGGFERELGASHSELTLEAEGPLLALMDRMRLEQIVSNLVSNAIRYGDGKPIAVTLQRAGSCVELTVADSGIGIPPAEQGRIFQRFERVHTQFRSGFGVGLWMVQQLTEAMGGSVKVTSAPGEGSTFRVTLPINRDGSDDDR
jgi:signal transduction histidine kinase